jgi:hypothetical protein
MMIPTPLDPASEIAKLKDDLKILKNKYAMMKLTLTILRLDATEKQVKEIDSALSYEGI